MSSERICGMIEQRIADVRARERTYQKTWLHSNGAEESREAYTLMAGCAQQVEALTWVLSLLTPTVHSPAPPRDDTSTVDLLAHLFTADPTAANWSLQVLADRVGRSKTSVAKAKAKALNLYTVNAKG